MSPTLIFYERNDLMKITANTKSVIITEKEKLTSGAYNNMTIEVELSEEYNGLTTFVTFAGTKVPVIANQVYLPTLKAGSCRVGVYAIEIENNEVKLRYSPAPDYITVSTGSFNPSYDNDDQVPTPTEGERIFEAIQLAIEQGKMKGDKGDKGDNATINGESSINIIPGNNISLTQENESLIINTKDDFYSKTDSDSRYVKSSTFSTELDKKQNQITVGEGLKLKNDILQLDIPIATSLTEYGGEV